MHSIQNFKFRPCLSRTSVIYNISFIRCTINHINSMKRYYQNKIFKRWINFCSKESINSLQPNTVNISVFLPEEFKRCLSYNSLVSVRSALSHCLPYDFINHNTVSTFLKGVYNLRPLVLNCFANWDLNTLLSHLQHKDISVLCDIAKKNRYTFYDSCRQKGQYPCLPKSKKTCTSQVLKLLSLLTRSSSTLDLVTNKNH